MDELGDLLAAYDGLQPGYDRVVALKQKAETEPEYYAEADELEADLNEDSRLVLERLVALLRREI